MKVQIPERQLFMYETLFADVLNPDHELLRAAGIIDWDGLHEVCLVTTVLWAVKANRFD
jgi:hypothetical protein